MIVYTYIWHYRLLYPSLLLLFSLYSYKNLPGNQFLSLQDFFCAPVRSLHDQGRFLPHGPTAWLQAEILKTARNLQKAYWKIA